MRITSEMMFAQIQAGMMKRENELSSSYERVVSGKRIKRPSDDPAVAERVMGYRGILSKIEQHERNITSVQNRLSFTKQALDSSVKTIQQLKQVALGQSITTAAERQQYAATAQKWLDELIGVANTEVGGEHLFAGYGNSAPFDANGNATGNISGDITVEIDTGINVRTNSVGEKVFKGVALPGGVDVFGVITNFITALNSNNDAGIQAALTGLNSSETQLLNGYADLEARNGIAGSVKERLAGVKLAVQNTLSKEEDMDMAEAITEFRSREQSLEAARAAAARVFEIPSLMDFLK